MATLHVRNVPDELYERVRQLAARRNRSISAEVISLLGIAARPDEDAVFERINRRRSLLRQRVGEFPSSVMLIREDRDR